MIKCKIKFILGAVLIWWFLMLLLAGLTARETVWQLGQGGTHLFVFTNEAEARPCGGFISAFGVVDLWDWRWDFFNSYHLDYRDQGRVEYPLNLIAKERYFWDLGIDADLGVCAARIKHYFQQSTGELADKVWLVDYGTVAKIWQILNPKTAGDQLFAELSRAVADVDRHNIEALNTRKLPVKLGINDLFFSALIRPHRWPQLARLWQNALQQGNVFVAGISPDIYPHDNDFALWEWNLGGGKSSRLLHKKLQIFAKQQADLTWKVSTKITVLHRGAGFDEPLSQQWKGVIQLQLPTVFAQAKESFELVLAPGETWEIKKEYTLAEWPKVSATHDGFGVFRLRGQPVWGEIFVSLYPQQILHTDDLVVTEHSGYWTDIFNKPRYLFSWQAIEDKVRPFITLHELIPWRESFDNWFVPRNDTILAEVHFNEDVELQPNFSVVLLDQDITTPKITDHPLLLDYHLLDDKRTLVLQFVFKEWQDEESLRLTVDGVWDKYQNPLTETLHTIIMR